MIAFAWGPSHLDRFADALREDESGNIWIDGTTSSTDNTWVIWDSYVTTTNLTISREDETDEDVKRRLLQEHAEECRTHFARPPKKSGRGRPPTPRWGPRPPRKPKRRTTGRRRR